MKGGAVKHNFERGPPKTITAKLGLICISGLKKEN
jgi:hypothetical protein